MFKYPHFVLPQKRIFRKFVSESVLRQNQGRQFKATSTMYYAGSVSIIFVGLSFAAVPIYQMICSTTGIDGTPKTGPGTKWALANITTPAFARPLKISFDSSVSELMPWKFLPDTRTVTVKPGDTALAFFKAQNNSSEPVTGISTYSVIPYKAAVCHVI